MTRRYHANNVYTTLFASITNAQTTLIVASATGLPTITTDETYRLTLSQNGQLEIVTVTSVSGTTLTITRGVEGTTAQAFLAGASIELRATADSLDRKADMISTAGDVLNFGDATSLEIPNNATATLSAAGQVALDTSVTDYADGLLCYRAGSTDYAAVAVPKADLASPTNNYVVTYDSSTDKFKLAAGGGGGGTPGGSTTQVQYNNAGSFAGAAGFTFDGTGTVTTTVGLVTPTLTATAAAVIGGNSTAAGYIQLLEDSDNGSNYVQIQAPASLAGNVTYTLPTADGSNTYVLTTNGSGTLSWAAPGGGGGGSGDVVGPASATDNAIARYDTTTGKLLQNSGATVTDDSNVTANNVLPAYTTTATAAGTTTLTVASTYQQFFTGSTTQNCRLPVTSTLALGFSFKIVNLSTGVVTVQSSGANTIVAMAANTAVRATCILTSGTTAASWSYEYIGRGSVPDADYGDITVASGAWTIDSPSNVVIASGDKFLLKTSASSFANMAGVAASNVASQATAVGTLTTGTWNATAIAYNYGGTGLTAVAQGDLIYGTNATTWARLTKDTNATRYLSNQGTSNSPSWNQVNLANGVTGTLPIANGGTGSATGSATNLIAESCEVYKSAVQSITNATVTTITWDLENWDNTTMHDNATNNSRITAATAGLYLVTANLTWGASNTGVRQIFLYKNGVFATQQTIDSNISDDSFICKVFNLAATDYIEVRGYQASGGSLNIDVAGSLFGMTKIGKVS